MEVWVQMSFPFSILGDFKVQKAVNFPGRFFGVDFFSESLDDSMILMPVVETLGDFFVEGLLYP